MRKAAAVAVVAVMVAAVMVEVGVVEEDRAEAVRVVGGEVGRRPTSAKRSRISSTRKP